MKEEIRSLEPFGFPGYFASSMGDVFSDRKGGKRRLVKRIKVGNGYAWFVSLRTATGKIRQKSVATLVLLAFRGENTRTFATRAAIYLDGNKDNCRLDNLQWRTGTKESCVKITLDASYIQQLEKMAAPRKITINKVAQEILVDILSKEK